MKALVLGAGRGVPLPMGPATPKCLMEGLAGWRVLDWLLNALRQGGGVDDFVFVGGDGIDRIRQAYPELRYVHNPRWQEHHVLGSLFAAEHELTSPFFFTYSDVVYRPDTVRALTRSPGEISLVIDTAWRTRYGGRSPRLLESAEKVVVRDGHVAAIGKLLPCDGDVTGEFIGLARFGARGAAALRSAYHALRPLYRDRPYRGTANLDNGHLTDLLQELIDQGARIDVVPVEGDWAELDEPGDLAQFVFGTKAETLERLRPLLTAARISDGVRFEVGQWRQDPDAWTRTVAERFGARALAVRSSAVAEDGASTSLAGRYRSIVGVRGEDSRALQTAVDEVVESYRRDGTRYDDQVLVQPCLEDVCMSGVMMTRDLDSGAEYTVIHYDDRSQRTDTVTSGCSAATETVAVHRGAEAPPTDVRLAALLDTAAELEGVTGSNALDVEFAFTADGTLHVLQVRPIAAASRWVSVDRSAHEAEVNAIRSEILRRQEPPYGVVGATTVFGQMPDWNPAEMIGTHPMPLARSLYERLITDRAWREARARLGYRDAAPHHLMVTLAGRPYVDVRLSSNNLLPAGLHDDVARRVVDAGIARLRALPALHDKIEFEIWPTCLHFTLDATMAGLIEYGLPPDDVLPYRQALHELTADLLETGRWIVGAQLAEVERLAPLCDSILGQAGGCADVEGHPRRVAQLLESVVEQGTIPFAILARLAFVGTSLLRSMHARGLLSDAERDAFFAGIETVGGRLVRDVEAMQAGDLDRAEFLARYGHLRPGAYDLLSPRYDAAAELYFPETAGQAAPASPQPAAQAAPGPHQPAAQTASSVPQRAAPLELPQQRLRTLEVQLRLLDLEIDAEELLAFCAEATAAREDAKFAFTRSLSAALELVAQWGEGHGLSREETALLEIDDVLAWANRPEPAGLASQLRRKVADARLQRQVARSVILPPLLTGPADLEIVRRPALRPNFVTGQRVVAPAVELRRDVPRDLDLRGSIVLVEGADPGYDWLFARSIAGLVTCYGGANSHMTIRCAEFGLPAAIGCGEGLYARLRGAQRLELDCGGEIVRAV